MGALESLGEIKSGESAEEKQAAILVYQKAIRENPQYLDEFENSPKVEYDQPARAEEYFDKALELCNSGRSLARALENIDLAIKLAPEHSESHNVRGIILDLMNKNEAAILAYKEAIRLDPHNLDAIENLQEIEDEEPVKIAKSSSHYSSQENWVGTSFLRIAWWGIILLVVLWGLYYVFQEFGRIFF